MKMFLLDAIENDDTDVICENISKIPKFAEELISQAIKSPSCQMLELLLDACIGLPIDQSRVLFWAIDAGNVEAARILLDREASNGKLATALSSGFERLRAQPYDKISLHMDMIQLFLQYNLEERNFLYYDAFLDLVCLLPSGYEPELEGKIIKCLGLMQSWTYMKERLLQHFKTNARRCCSIAIARFLLEIGLDVNHRSGNNAHTALYFAAGRQGQRAAELMRFLLESGADPSVKSPKRIAIAEKPGPRNIEKWLGISWDQLVQESAKVYAASLPSADEKEHSIQEDDDANGDDDITQLDDKDNASSKAF